MNVIKSSCGAFYAIPIYKGTHMLRTANGLLLDWMLYLYQSQFTTHLKSRALAWGFDLVTPHLSKSLSPNPFSGKGSSSSIIKYWRICIFEDYYYSPLRKHRFQFIAELDAIEMSKLSTHKIKHPRPRRDFGGVVRRRITPTNVIPYRSFPLISHLKDFSIISILNFLLFDFHRRESEWVGDVVIIIIDRSYLLGL